MLRNSKSRRKQNPGTKVTPDTPPKQKAGVLTGQEIAELEIVQNGADDCLRAASCNLRLGPKVFVCGTQTVDYLDLDPANPSKAGATIPSFGTIVFSTAETICTPHNVIGRFDLKIKLALYGLILQVGPQVEPGYKGPLFGMILNAGSEAKTIKCNESFLTIEFSYTSEQPEEDLIEEEIIQSLPDFIGKNNLEVDQIAKQSIIAQVRDEFALTQKRKLARALSRRELWILIAALVGMLFGVLSYLFPRRVENVDPGDQPLDEDRPVAPGESEQGEDAESNRPIGSIQ